jgi:phosphatidylglycerophosphatase A
LRSTNLGAINVFKFISTLGPVGYMPVAPGTFGTAVSLLFVAALRPSGIMLASLIIISTIVGTVASHFAEISFGEKDPQKIVIDEFTGFLVSMSFLEITTTTLILAFIFFRIYDILKPPPIRSFEVYFRGGVGIMLDDILAAVYTLISVLICNTLIKAF